MKIDLLSDKELPSSFLYPREFLRVLNLGIVDLEPWYFLQGKPLRDTYDGLKKRYPERVLVPFSRRQDNDDIACWEITTTLRVIIIHDFASKGYENRESFCNFYEWLRRAVEDMIDFDDGES
jgi:hypothetical protein